MIASQPFEEVPCQETLRRNGGLEIFPEQALNDLTRLAAIICETPIAFISLADEHGRRFESRIGLAASEMPHAVSFCRDGPAEMDLCIVPDARAEERLAGHPLVTGTSGWRFFAGAALAMGKGASRGILGVIDRKPRTLTPAQEEALRALGRQAGLQIELRGQGRELRASEGKLRAILEAEPECVKLLGPDATLYEMNAAGLRLIEAECVEMVAGKTLLPLVVPEDRETVREMLQAVAQGETRSVQFRLVGLKGTLRWVEMSGAPFSDEATGRTLVVAHSRDVTERKRVEAKIQRLNRLYAVSSGINEAIVRIEETTSLYEQACRIAVEQGGLVMAWVGLVETGSGLLRPVARWGRDEGYLDAIEIRATPERPEGQGPAGVAFRTGKPAWSNDIDADIKYFASRAQALQRGYRSCAAFPLTLEGRSAGVLVVYGDQPAYFDREELHVLSSLAENIAFAVECIHRNQRRLETELERTRAAEALRASEGRYRTLFEYAPDGIVIADAQSSYIDANASALRMLGYSRDEFVGLHASDIVVTDEIQHIEPALSAIRAKSDYHREWQFRRKDGSVFPAEVIATMMPDGKLLGMIRDVTERKRLEQQLLRSQRMESIGTLAGGIAHDLNNVLSPIMMSLSVLEMTFNDPNSQEMLAMLRASAQRGADMVRQILSFARGVEGRRMEVQIKHLIHEIERIARDTFPKSIQTRTEAPRLLATVMADPTQLHQVLLNLCVNARDAMPKGGTLSISVEDLTLDEHYAALNPEALPGPYVLVQIEDTGEGIPPEVLEKIFDPFFTTKEIGKGTGLGLSTSLGIVKSHGGFLRVYSELGKGTKFCVYLPAQTEPTESAPPESEVEMHRGHGELILVADDESFVRQVIRQTLEAFGYRVELAGDGAEALAVYAARREEIAVVVMDMMMPVLDGPATIQVLRRMNPAVRIIAASGLATNGHEAQAAKLRVKHFLPKPYTAEALLTALKEILGEDGEDPPS